MSEQPQTLLDAVRYFSDPQVCFETMLAVKWPGGKITCPKCAGDRVGVIKSRRMLQCKTVGCRKQFSLKVRSIFEDSPLSLQKWFVAIWSVANAKHGISSCNLARALGVEQKTAWFMLHRVRLAMRTKTFRKLTGEVEADETFIGGKSENMHKWKRAKRILGRGAVGKAIVQGLLERGGEARCTVIPNTDADTIRPIVTQHVEPFVSTIYSDAAGAYGNLDWRFARYFVDHVRRYVAGRFSEVLRSVVGKRITYRVLTATDDAGFMGIT